MAVKSQVAPIETHRRGVTLGAHLIRRFAKNFWWTLLVIVVCAGITQVIIGYYVELSGSWWYHIIINAKYSLAVLAAFVPGMISWAVGTCGLTRKEFVTGVHLAIFGGCGVVLLVFVAAFSAEMALYRAFDFELTTTSTYSTVVINNYGDLLANSWIFLITYPMVTIFGWLVGTICANKLIYGFVSIIPAIWMVLLIDNVVFHGDEFAFLRDFDLVPPWLGVIICLGLIPGGAWLASRFMRNADVSTSND